jgi:hypothetical protein
MAQGKYQLGQGLQAEMSFATFFAIQFVQYLIVTVNMRAVSAGKYRWTAITDFAIAGLGFVLIQRVAETHSAGAWLGYALGGVAGSQVGIWLSKRLWA